MGCCAQGRRQLACFRLRDKVVRWIWRTGASGIQAPAPRRAWVEWFNYEGCRCQTVYLPPRADQSNAAAHSSLTALHTFAMVASII